MVQLTREATSENIIVTLNEKRTITLPFYLFVFENVTTKEQVKFVINSTSDLSLFPERYNEFAINTSAKFSAATPGQWNYYIYEQNDITNTNPEGLAEVETGKMILKSTTFNYAGYDTATSYKGYGG